MQNNYYNHYDSLENLFNATREELFELVKKKHRKAEDIRYGIYLIGKLGGIAEADYMKGGNSLSYRYSIIVTQVRDIFMK